MANRIKYSDNLKKLIRDFEYGSLDLDIDVIKHKLNVMLSGYTCITRRMESHYAFRARINEGAELFSKAEELWYPPKEFIRKMGRLNRAHEPIFYISASHETATLEVRPNVGDHVTILRVKLNDAQKLPHVMELGVTESQPQHGLEVSTPLPEWANTKGIFHSQEEARKNMLIRSCIARLMMKVVPDGKEQRYKKSIAIAETLMASPYIDGVLYPSIAGDGSRKGGGMNMAIKPDSADNLFLPDHAWVSVVEARYETHGYIMRCIKNISKIENGHLLWNNA
jgi:hypothetical protein